MREPFDDTTKQFYRRFFEKQEMSRVESELEVFSNSRRIDLVVECNDEDIIKLRETIFYYFLWLNAIELKGPNDPLTFADYNLILGRVLSLGAMAWPEESAKDIREELQAAEGRGKRMTKEELMPHELYALLTRRTLTIITVGCPIKILKWFKDDFGFRPVEPGIYHRNDLISQWIICPTELRLVPKNYPLLPLAKGKKLEKFIEVCLKEGLFDYLGLVMHVGVKVDPDTLWQKMKEVRNMPVKIRPETLGYIDEFFRNAPDFFDDVPIIQEKMAEREQQAVQEAVQRAEQRSKQQMLITLLGQKFAFVPDVVVAQIEGTTNKEQLDNWLKQVLFANTLEQMGFSAYSTNGKDETKITNGTNGSH